MFDDVCRTWEFWGVCFLEVSFLLKDEVIDVDFVYLILLFVAVYTLRKKAGIAWQ